MDAFCYFCIKYNFPFRGALQPNQNGSSIQSMPFQKSWLYSEASPEFWWPSGYNSVISGRCCGHPRVFSFTLSACLPYWLETIYEPTIFLSTCELLFNGDFHKPVHKCRERKTEMKPQMVRYILFAAAWYLGIQCCGGCAKLLGPFSVLCHQSRLAINLRCKCETDPVALRFALFHIRVGLAFTKQVKSDKTEV